MPASGAGGRVDALDGLRTVLVTGVMLHHLEWTIGAAHPRFLAGWLPVDGFFVLSGYLIATNLLGELDATGSIAYGRFLWRRICRLYPALLVLLASVGLVSVLIDGRPFADTWPTLASAASYVHNLSYVRGWFEPLLPAAGPLWSLAIEFQFYVAVPLVLIGFARLRLPRAWWVIALAGVAVGSAAWRGTGGFGGFPRTYLFTPMRLDSLMCGVLIALAGRHLARLPVAAVRVAAGAGTAGLVVMYLSLSAYEDATYRWGIAAAGLASAAVIVHLLGAPASVAARTLGRRPLAALGRRSYAAYLWHQLVFLLVRDHTDLPTWATVLAALVVTWVVADASYRFVEVPLLDRRRAVKRDVLRFA